jgi:hypothetical protein
LNDSARSTLINLHERNIETKNSLALSNETNEIASFNENPNAINKHELNIDTKSESFLSKIPQTCDQSNQLIRFLGVKKVEIKVKSIDMTFLKSMTKPKNEAKRFKVIANSNDPKLFISDQTFGLINNMHHCNHVQSNGVKCNFASPYISYYKKHLKDKGHTEQENPQNLQPSYSTLSESNRHQKNAQSSQNSNRNNFNRNNNNKSNYGSRPNNQRHAKGSGNYYSARKNK